MGRSSKAKNRRNPKKVKCDRQTNRRTNGPMDRRQKRGVESRSTRLKSDYKLKHHTFQIHANLLLKLARSNDLVHASAYMESEVCCKMGREIRMECGRVEGR